MERIFKNLSTNEKVKHDALLNILSLHLSPTSFFASILAFQFHSTIFRNKKTKKKKFHSTASFAFYFVFSHLHCFYSLTLLFSNSLISKIFTFEILLIFIFTFLILCCLPLHYSFCLSPVLLLHFLLSFLNMTFCFVFVFVDDVQVSSFFLILRFFLFGFPSCCSHTEGNSYQQQQQSIECNQCS